MGEDVLCWNFSALLLLDHFLVGIIDECVSDQAVEHHSLLFLLLFSFFLFYYRRGGNPLTLSTPSPLPLYRRKTLPYYT